VQGDPSVGRWMRYAFGGRLPKENVEWVRHDLLDAGWRVRLLLRVLVQLVPFTVAFAFAPGLDPLAKGLLVAILPVSALMTIGMTAEQVRDRRLRQHGLPLPDPRR
jgi:hypothetical protein